jgi:uncharacterized protein DUF6249
LQRFPNPEAVVEASNRQTGKDFMMKTYTGLLIVTVSALVAASAYAAGTSDEVAVQTTNSGGALVRVGDQVLPRALADKLSSDQVATLLAAQGSRQSDGMPSGAVLICTMPFLMIVAIVVVNALAQMARNQRLHRTLAAMIEKGVPIPPELLQPTEPVKPRRSDLRRGLTACGVGLALMLFLGLQRGELFGIEQKEIGSLWAVGFIPLFVGIGYLIAWKLEQGKPNS